MRSDLLKRTQGLGTKPTTKPKNDDSIYGMDWLEFLGDDDPGDDPDAWLIEGIVAAEVPQLILGSPKAKKTFIAIDLAICIAAGVDWLGRPSKQGKVFLLLREDSLRECRRRIWRVARGLGVDPRTIEANIKIDCLSPFYWTDPDSVAKLDRTIARFQPVFVVIDSLARTVNGDENSKKEMSPLVNNWCDLCQKHKVAIAIIHHFSKSGSGSLINQARGSNSIPAAARHMIGVEKAEEHDGPFTISADGNQHPLPAPFRMRMFDSKNARGQRTIVFEHAGDVEAGKEKQLQVAIRAALRKCRGGYDAEDLRRKTLGADGKQFKIRPATFILVRDAMPDVYFDVLRGKYTLTVNTSAARTADDALEGIVDALDIQ